MASITSRVVPIVVIFIATLAGFGSSLRIVIEPQELSEYTDVLSVTCLAYGYEHRDKTITGIRISKKGSDDPIATIDDTKGLIMGKGKKDNMKVDGKIGNESTKSYMALSITKPTVQDTGTYRCQMFFSDKGNEKVFGNVTFEVCSYGWTYYADDKTCLKVFGNSKKCDGEPVTWTKAREICRSFGGDLVEIRDQKKNTFVYNMGHTHYPWGGFWIGVRNVATHGYEFKYVDGSPVTYHPWYPHQPVSNCAFMYIWIGENGQWGADDCTTTSSFMCSKPAK